MPNLTERDMLRLFSTVRVRPGEGFVLTLCQSPCGGGAAGVPFVAARDERSRVRIERSGSR